MLMSCYALWPAVESADECQDLLAGAVAGLADMITWPKILTAEGTTFVNVTSISVRDFLARYEIPKVWRRLL